MTGIILSENGANPKSYLKDSHGNVTSIYNGSQLENTYQYSAFGNEITGNAFEQNPFGYCGEYTDNETGLVYLRNRYYSAATGRFLTEDPIRSGLNWYVYCENNPVLYMDSTGLDIYYYVNTEFKKEAEKDKKKLEKMYDEPVHILETDSRDSFIEEWNKIGSWDGEDVTVSLVVINMHGSPEVLTPHPNRDTGCISAEDVDNGTLISKNIGDMLILGCNSGHFDHRYSSIANRFLVNNNVNSVIASDGTVTSRSVFGNYKSKGNPSFVKYLWSAHKYRDNFGFIQYTKNEKGELEYSIIGKKVSAKSIFKALGKDV